MNFRSILDTNMLNKPIVDGGFTAKFLEKAYLKDLRPSSIAQMKHKPYANDLYLEGGTMKCSNTP